MKFKMIKFIPILVIAALLVSGCKKNDESDDKNSTRALPGTIYKPSVKKFKPIKGTLPKGANILLIVIDALRADRLGCYGYKDQPTSPAIDSIASESILFERFYAASPWTAPSFGTMLTGVSPLIHRTGWWIKNKKAGTVQIGSVNLYPLNPRLYTLAELLNTKVTATFASNPFLDPKLGFAQGVDHYDQTFGHRRATVVTNNMVKWLRNNGNQQFFIMLHYMDTHTPYDPLPRYKKDFAGENSGRIKTPFTPNPMEAIKLHPSKSELKYIKGLYNGELRLVDDQIKRVYNELEKMDLLKNTWVVITADHGEEQWDHGDFNHGFQYEDEVTRVPLIIRAPGGKWGAGKRVPYSVPMVDLMPTILTWFNVSVPKYVEGKDFMPILTGKEKKDRPCYMEFQLYRRQKYAYFDGRYKIIKPLRGPGTYLYDLGFDVKEKFKIRKRISIFNRVERAMEIYRKSRLALLTKINSGQLETKTDIDTDEDSNQQLSDDAVNALKALGYIK